MFLGAPDENVIAATVKRYTQAGWLYVTRKESEGLFGFGAHSSLTFSKLAHGVHRRRPAEERECLTTLLVWVARLVALAFVAYFLLTLVAAYG